MKNIKVFTLLLLFYFISNSFKNKIDDSSMVDLFPLNDTCQFLCLLDGKKISFNEENGKKRNGSNISKNLKKKPDSCSFIFQSFFYKYPAGQTDIQLNLGTLKQIGTKISNLDFINFFKVKEYKYSEFAENGIEIIYRDKNAEKWSSSKGIQDNSIFEITEVKTDSINLKFKATFQCKLYNSTGTMKQLEKGVFIGYFRNN